MFSRLLSGSSLVTSLRYVLQAIGGILVANGQFEIDQWETISGAVLVVLPLVLGVKASITPKVVQPDGTTVKMDRMTVSEKTDVVQQATKAQKRRPNFLDAIFKRK